MYGQTGASDSTTAQAADLTQTVPSVKVTTRLVIVDVVAHDKKGHAITDLEATDLQILEDGNEQPIRSFVFQRGVQSAEKAAQEPASLPANMVSNARKFPPNAALNVVLLDSLNSNLLNQAYVRTEMVKFLEKLPQGQPVAIFTLGRKLHMVQDFTTDLTALKRVIAEFKGEGPILKQNPTGTSEVSMAPTGIAEQTLAEKAPQVLAQIKDFAEQTTSDQNDMRIQYTFAALTSLGRMLSRYKGRKNLIWVSESIPMNIFSDFNTITRVNPNAGGKAQGQNTGYKTNYGYADRLAYLGSLLADAQIAMYPIDARGLIGSPLYNVASNLSGQGGSALGGLAMKAEGKQSEELFQSHVAMLDLADKTGGKAYYNRNDINNALSDGIDDGSTYYMVGYYPQNKKWDGRFRKIEVKTRRQGINLRYRTGYFAIDRPAYLAQHPEQTDIDFSQALNLESPITSALQFRAEVNPPAADSPLAADSKTVLLRYAIDPSEIQFTTGADGLQHAQVDCAVRAFAPNDLDKPVKTDGTKMNAALKPDALAKIKSNFFPCELKVDLPPGQYLLRLAVRDGSSGNVGSANAQVTVPAQPVAKR